MLFRVLIIDDEPWIIDGMKKTVSWENVGFVVVGDAADAYEGIDKIHELKPDVVFVDIRMPEMSGLEMINRIKGEGYDIEFVVISGYSEFSYAKESITLGVNEYILKPIHKDELMRNLSKLTDKLNAKRKRISFCNLELMEQMAQGDNNEEQTMCLLNRLGVGNSAYIKRIAFVKFLEEGAFFPNYNQNALNLTAIPVGNGCYFMTMCYDDIDESGLQDVLKNCTKNLKCLGVSREMTALDSIHISIHEAELAAANEFIFGSGNIYFYRKPDYASAMGVVNDMIRGISNLDFSPVYANIENLKDLLIERQWGIEELCFIYNCIQQHMMYQDAGKEEGANDFLTSETIIREFKDFNDFVKYFKNVLTGIEEVKLANNFTKYKETIKGIITYVNSHYTEEIRHIDVSNMFFINPNYLSIVFKQTTGKTFSQYLAEIRMRKACELLSQTGMSLEEICGSIGYTDYYSFIKAFKKIYGITPGKFKRESARN